ncbi:MAG: hypothetical protein V7708_17350 [Oceanicoccus sp.]
MNLWKINTIVLLVGVLTVTAFIAPQAQAGRTWKSSEINAIKIDTNSAKRKAKQAATNSQLILNGEIGDVARETRDRLDQFDFPFQDSLLRETVDDSIQFMQYQKEDYLIFVGDRDDKCSSGSPCGDLLTDLRFLIQNFSSLSSRYKFANNMVFADSNLLLERIDKIPPFMLFALSQLANGEMMESLLDMPADLADIYDEIDDPGLFSPDFLRGAKTGEETAIPFYDPNNEVYAASTPQERRAAREARRDDRRAARQARRENRRDATTRFCGRLINGENGLNDPIRLNRIRLYIAYYEAITGFLADWWPDDVELTAVALAGGGSAIPDPSLKPLMIFMDKYVGFIGAAVDTRIANLDVCRGL